ncbi:MAG: hypothetical protein NTZ05_16350 [Chloroflexi bacterium]|nr:hypothetical protein [Chloroflexota bacterium]
MDTTTTDDVHSVVASGTAPTDLSGREGQLSKVFRMDGEGLKLIEYRLKAKTQLDYIQRLVVLFLCDHQQNGQERVARADVNALLSAATLNSGYARTWLAHNQDLVVDGNQLSLSMPGRERAALILAEVLDPNAPNTWPLSSRTQGRSIRKSHDESSDGGKSTKRKPGRDPESSKWVVALLLHHAPSNQYTRGELRQYAANQNPQNVSVAVSRLLKEKDIRPTNDDAVALTPNGQRRVIEVIVPKWRQQFQSRI